jgi:hypothetical protein
VFGCSLSKRALISQPLDPLWTNRPRAGLPTESLPGSGRKPTWTRTKSHLGQHGICRLASRFKTHRSLLPWRVHFSPFLRSLAPQFLSCVRVSLAMGGDFGGGGRWIWWLSSCGRRRSARRGRWRGCGGRLARWRSVSRALVRWALRRGARLSGRGLAAISVVDVTCVELFCLSTETESVSDARLRRLGRRQDLRRWARRWGSIRRRSSCARRWGARSPTFPQGFRWHPDAEVVSSANALQLLCYSVCLRSNSGQVRTNFV